MCEARGAREDAELELEFRRIRDGAADWSDGVSTGTGQPCGRGSGGEVLPGQDRRQARRGAEGVSVMCENLTPKSRRAPVVPGAQRRPRSRNPFSIAVEGQVTPRLVQLRLLEFDFVIPAVYNLSLIPI